MISKFLKIYFIICIQLVLSAQNFPVSDIYVQYDMTLNFKNIVKYKGELLSNNEVALFKYKVSDEQSSYNEEYSDSGSNVNVTMVDSVTTYIYINKSTDEIIESRKEVHSKKNFLIKDKLDRIEWNLINETKTINGLLCNKASCNFKGRTYLVWYCKDIASNFGPWKLMGLPGLILEATDQLGQVSFYAKKIKVPYVNDINSTVLVGKDYYTTAEFGEIQEKESEDFQSKMATKFGRGVSVKIDYKIEGIEK
jgi:GLPGLI family protein